MNEIIFGEQYLTIENIVDISENGCQVALSSDHEFKKQIDNGVAYLNKLLKEKGQIYGVTTGYGNSVNNNVPEKLLHDLPVNLYRFLGCGQGDKFSVTLTRAIVSARLCSLSKGYSGVRWLLLEKCISLLNVNVMPVIPTEGSVGASGDLIPLSYLAAVLCGERSVWYKGNIHATEDIFQQLNIQPLNFQPKEALAVVNGTAAMTGLACVAYKRADFLSKLSSRITALASVALLGNPEHFDEKLFQLKPHPGQESVAKWIREALQGTVKRDSNHLQDRYSLRCAPHIIGVLEDSLPWMRQFIEKELNSANDNPLIDSEQEKLMHGGHFYGGHIAFAMDGMKNAIANIADLLDRQIALLVDTKFNQGLSDNLTGANAQRKKANHGLKGIQIASSAFVSEALKLTMPASVFSRSTECHNQDKVSLGTISARDCLRILQLTEQVAACALIVSCQALELRLEAKTVLRESLSEEIISIYEWVRKKSLYLGEDRELECDLQDLVAGIQSRSFHFDES